MYSGALSYVAGGINSRTSSNPLITAAMLELFTIITVLEWYMLTEILLPDYAIHLIQMPVHRRLMYIYF